MHILRKYRKIITGLAILVAAWFLVKKVQQISEAVLPVEKSMSDDSAMQSFERIHADRRSNILKFCQKDEIKQSDEINDMTRFHMIPMEKYNITFCTIQKVASSFWRRLFVMMKRESEFSSVYDVPLNYAFLHNMVTMNKINPEKMKKILNSSKKIIFVRHPYTRLYSAYIDKVFSVNPWYWRHISPWIEHFRKNGDHKSKRCVNDVTFKEFVRLFVRFNFLRKDFHFIPMYKHCSPCDVKYDFIGKIEKFSEDSNYILEKIGLNSLKNSINMYKNLSKTDIILSKIPPLFSHFMLYKNCLTFYEAVKRIWKEFQIRGMIDKYFDIPVSEKGIKNFTIVNVTNMFVTAVKYSTDKRVLARSKFEALFDAFSSLDTSDFIQLKNIFEKDCGFFDYECDPDNFLKYLSRQLHWNLQ